MTAYDDCKTFKYRKVTIAIMLRGKHSDLTCTICGTDIEVPMCCEKEMWIEDNVLVCEMCGNQKNIPICCGKGMKVARSK